MNTQVPLPPTSILDMIMASATEPRIGTSTTAESEHSGTLAYLGQKQGYLGTGFSFASVHRLGIVEDHPAIMRYNALKQWAAQAYPARGTRPAWVNEELTRLSGHASRAKRAQTPDQRLAYSARHMAREAAFLACRGRWPETLPELPHVGSPRGRSKRAILEKVERAPVRPASSWHAQVLEDMEILRELGHKIPRSLRPTQTWWQMRDNGRGAELQAVPLNIAYHSWLSCNGRYNNGKPCPHCVKQGRHRSKRDMSAGRLELPGDIP